MSAMLQSIYPQSQPRSDLDLTPSAACVDLIAIDFAGRWSDWIDPRHLDGMRVIGVLEFRLDGRNELGVLCKRAHAEGYAVVTQKGPLSAALPNSDVEDFLFRVRKGRGGRGRGQGRPSKDGVCYPRRKEITISQNMVLDLMKLGSSLSDGIRAAVHQVDIDACRNTPDPGGQVTRCKIYLDAASLEKISSIGDGNISRGVRRIWWHLAGRRAWHPLAPNPDQIPR
jgi:hypothetical protein